MPGSSSLIEAKNDSAQGVVPALAGAAMGQGYLAVGSEAGELGGGVLAVPVAVEDHAWRWVAGGDSVSERAGFDVLSYEETYAWHDRQQPTGQALLAAAAELAAESGSTAAQQRARITRRMRMTSGLLVP